jgi:hypothetical protein
MPVTAIDPNTASAVSLNWGMRSVSALPEPHPAAAMSVILRPNTPGSAPGAGRNGSNAASPALKSSSQTLRIGRTKASHRSMKR